MVKVRSRVRSSTQLLIKSIAAETNRLIQQEQANIINLSQGVPNLPMFHAASEAIQSLLETRRFPYTDVAGLLDVRQTAASFINSQYFPLASQPPLPSSNTTATVDGDGDGFAFDANHIVITAGAAQAVYNALALSIESQDDVVLSPLPAYGLYKHQTEILGGTFDTIPSEACNSFIPSIANLEQAFDRYAPTQQQQQQRIRSIILCYPNNPVGSVLTAEHAAAIAAYLDQQLLAAEQRGDDGFSVILDEVYIGITSAEYDTAKSSILAHASKRLLNACFLVLSASKGLGAIPGVRAGILACPNKHLIDNVIKIQTACTANASILSQCAIKASLEHVMREPLALVEVASYVNRNA
jgi:aspartate/methionine/tyrosine aminotransferase